MKHQTSLFYWKNLVLWNEAINKKTLLKHLSSGEFSPAKTSEKAKELSESIEESVFGYRLFRKPGLFNLENFSLEKGCWSKYDYIRDWIYLVSFSDINSSKTARRLTKAILNYAQKHNVEPIDLLDELWDEYWVIDVSIYAEVRKLIIYGNNNASIEDIEDLYINTTERISSAKTQSKDLDDWIGFLHKLIPVLMFGISISNINNSDAKKYNRYFEEAKADIFAVFSICLQKALINEPYGFSKYFISLQEKDKDRFNRELKYSYNSRVSIPKYWFDMAKECFCDESRWNSLSKQLNEFDRYSVLGWFCHASTFHVRLSLEYIFTGELPSVKGNTFFVKN